MKSDLQGRAMLVDLDLGLWSAKKHDKVISAEVAEQHGTAVSVGRYTKQLLPNQSTTEKREGVKKAITVYNPIYQNYSRLHELAGEGKTYHYKFTLPWQDDGKRILPSAMFLDYSEMMKRKAREFERVLPAFVSDFPQLVDYARGKLNGMFREDDYPDVAKLQTKFYWRVKYLPLPSGQDFRVDLREEDLANIRAQIESDTQTAVENSVKDLWARLHEAVHHIVERLSDPEGKFKDTLVTNLTDLCQNVLPKLNVIGDQNLESMRQQALSGLGKFSAQTLRDSKQARQQIASEALAIEDAMRAFMGA